MVGWGSICGLSIGLEESGLGVGGLSIGNWGNLGHGSDGLDDWGRSVYDGVESVDGVSCGEQRVKISIFGY